MEDWAEFSSHAPTMQHDSWSVDFRRCTEESSDILLSKEATADSKLENNLSCHSGNLLVYKSIEYRLLFRASNELKLMPEYLGTDKSTSYKWELRRTQVRRVK